MKRVVFVALMFAVITLPSPLGAQAPSGGAKPAPPPSTAKPAASSQTAGAPRTIELSVKDDMKFDKPALTAKPGEKLRIVLKNVGTMPKMAAGHNFVLLKEGVSAIKFAEASMMAAPTYIPESLKSQAIGFTTVTGPGETAELIFDAPAKPGVYNFICSFAGHFAQGMTGTLTVK